MYGNDYEYAGTRLNGTFVRLNNEPVYVERVSGCHEVHIMKLGTGFGDRFICGLSDLDVRPMKLGWINLENFSAVYVARRPMRRDWRQGLRRENMEIFFGGGLRPKDFDLLKTLHDMHCNKLSYKDCLDRTTKRGGVYKAPFAQSWHREWAMDNRKNLLWRFGQVVGSIDDKGRAVLLPSFNHLKESLRESF